ncbi:MAG: hypothetical protein ACRC8S_17305 [Fimbriiglobus sp.]
MSMRAIGCATLLAILSQGLMSLQADEPKTEPAKKVQKETLEEARKRQEAEEEKKQAEAQEKAEKEWQKQLKKTQDEVQKLSSHEMVKEVAIVGKTGDRLQTLAVDPTGKIYALVAPPKGYGESQKNAVSEVQVLNEDGKRVLDWSVKIHATAINVGHDGTVFVAGDGKLAKFTPKGEMIGEITEFPFISQMVGDKAAIRAAAEKQAKAQRKSYDQIIEQYQSRIKKIEEKAEELKKEDKELPKVQKNMLKQYQDSLKDIEESLKQVADVDAIVKSSLGRARVLNSIAVNEKEMYVVCGEPGGYGFAVWRMELDMKNPTKIMSGLSGCCGQMDVQCSGEDIIVAENTKHRYAKYTRDGKELSTGGKRGKETEPGCFGGCCNPMNVKAAGSKILTAESEGIIKMFNDAGKFEGIVGGVKISGGCKNVAIGTNSDASRVFFCDQPGSKVLILAKKDTKEVKEQK